ncbi:MAG TPA: hypothetical protein VFM64_00010 [Candidatus Nitrosotenuis sp.]|nr:hypothetical protein [Candidatus Nitrosotenuis sp.]
MNELDNFLSKAIILSIKNEMSEDRVKKLETEYGVKISEILDKKEISDTAIFEEECELMEDQVLREFLAINEDESTKERWIVIKNRQLIERILKTFADPEKKIILDLTRESAETIPKILVLSNLPNTSGYRKMNQLIEEGFVTSVGLAETFEGKRALVYRSIIQKIQIIINKNDIIAKILVPKDVLASSQIVSAITGLGRNKFSSYTN